MAAQLGRLLKQWAILQPQHCCYSAATHHLLHSPILTTKTYPNRPSITAVHLAARGVHKLSRGLRRGDRQDADPGSSGSDSDSVTLKSRNEMKRDARRAVRWAMDLAAFSTPQIKRILKHVTVVSLEQDVLDAVILAKKLGPDVREGKRRQFNYVGKLLRDVEPVLMDALIQATKDSDQTKLQALAGPEASSIDDKEDELPMEETDSEEEEEGSHVEIATRWFDGLISKDIEITKEVYSISTVEFDRQELRKLVRRVHSVLESKVSLEENAGKIDAERVSAEKSLTRFLRVLAKSSLLIDI